MPIYEQSLQEMIANYRATLKAGNKMKKFSMPDVNYGNPETHPGQPVGTDTVPAWLQPGEFVVNKAATDMYGSEIEQMNNQGQQMMDQNAILDNNPIGGMNYGGKVGYYQEGAVVQPKSFGQQVGDFAASDAGNRLGQRLALIGAGDLQGAAGVTAPDATKAETDAKDASQKIIALANEGKGLTAAAAQAGDFINGFAKLTKEEQAEVSEQEGRGNKILDTLKTGLQTVAGAFSATARVRREALERIAARKYKDSYAAFTRLQSVGENLALAYLPLLGPGPKTDTDLKVAREAVFNISAPSNTWIAQLDDTIARASGQKSIAPTAKNPNVPGDTPPPPGKPKAFVDQEGGVAQGIDEADASIASEGPGTKENPHVISTNIQRILKNKYAPKAAKKKAAQIWGRDNNVKPEDFVELGATVATFRELLEDIGGL